ncbi:MAG: hypothetical protein ACON4T_04490 [Synechococcus sp.]
MKNLQNLSQAMGPPAIVGSVVSYAGIAIVGVWMNSGLIREAWKALDYGKPTFSDLARFDGEAIGRLLCNKLVLFIIFFIIGFTFFGLAEKIFDINLTQTSVISLNIIWWGGG